MSNQKLFVASTVLLITSAYIVISTSTAQAATSCEVSLEATDMMKFSITEMSVPKTCKEFTVNLKNTGSMKKEIMGHNLVISKDSDKDAVLQEGSKAGLVADYVKPKDERVVANTKVIGSGESASTKFAVSKLNATDKFSFYCSFPGHGFVMKGIVKLV